MGIKFKLINKEGGVMRNINQSEKPVEEKYLRRIKNIGLFSLYPTEDTHQIKASPTSTVGDITYTALTMFANSNLVPEQHKKVAAAFAYVIKAVDLLSEINIPNAQKSSDESSASATTSGVLQASSSSVAIVNTSSSQLKAGESSTSTVTPSSARPYSIA